MKNIKILTKLIIYFLAIGFLITLVIGLFSYFQAQKALLKRTEEQLISIRDIKKSQIEGFMKERYADIEVLAQSKDVHNMITKIKEYQQNINISQFDDYPTNNEKYQKLWTNFGRYLISYKQTYDYHDLFILDGDYGHVLYTVEKESDLGTNLKHGKYRETSLAHLWKTITKTKEIQIADFKPYSPSNGDQSMFIGAPIIENGEVMSVIVLQISEIPINKIVNQRSGMGNSGELYIIGKWKEKKSSLRSNRIVKEGKIGDVKSDNIIKKCLDGDEGFETKIGSTGEHELVCYAPLKIKGLNWGVFSTIKESEIMLPAYNLGKIILLIGTFMIIALLILAYFLAKSFSVPILQTVEFAKQITTGDLTATININQKDEIGTLADTLKTMSEKLKEVIKTVRKASGNIGIAGNELNTSAQSMSTSSQQVSQGASEQAASTEQVSASIEEMNANIQMNTENAQQTERIALKAAEDILNGSKYVNITVEAMKNIAEKISIISEIADKTDLLAINAAIEAARAGEHGKGFAVVASEVRKLAENSNVAATEINSITKSSVQMAEKSGKLLDEIVPDIQNTSKLVQEISASSVEQSSGAAQINNAIQQLNSVTQQNASSSEEMASGAEEVSASSEELSRQADLLKATIAFFNTGKEKTEDTNNKNKIQNQTNNLNKKEKEVTERTIGATIDMTNDKHLSNEFESY